jgi:ATP-binding cassette subfamily B protein
MAHTHRRASPQSASGGNSPQPATSDDTTQMSGEAFLDHVALTVAARSQRRSAGRLVRLVRRSLGIAWRADSRVFGVNATLQLTAGLIAAVQVLVTKWVLDAILDIQNSTASVQAAVAPVVALAVLMAFTTVTTAVQGQLARLLGELVSRTTWRDILAVSTSVPLRTYETPSFYDQLQRVQTNALHRPFALCQGLIGLVGSVAGSVGLAVAIVALHPLLLPLLLLSGVPMLLSTRRASRMEFQFAVDQVSTLRMRDYLATVQTGRDEAKEVRAFGLAAALRIRYERIYGSYLTALRAHVGRRTWLAVTGSLASSLLLALTLIGLIWLVGQGQVSLAEAGAAIVAVRLLSQQLSLMFSSAQQIYEAGLFLDDLDRFLERAPAANATSAPTGGTEPVQPKAAQRGFDRLQVTGLEFSYPGSDRPALQGVDLEIHRGEVIALVGENGSGKTTLAKLVGGLFEPERGRITWDGRDVTRLDERVLHQDIAIIFQDFVRYQLPATENIAFGRADLEADSERIREAARQAGADDFLTSLPYGYDTILSKAFAGGRDLSLGQWQRVALARAFIRDAPFVILDEPSASLDPRAEHELFTSLRQILAGRTVLYVSHRMSTVREAGMPNCSACRRPATWRRSTSCE